MKISTKIFLPILLISALLILLAGCFGIPADESPGYTPWTEEDGLRVAFEDLPEIRACNDWDYNDWVGDINIVYNLLGPDKLTGIDFTITHVEYIASYSHEFHLIIPDGGVGGVYELNGSGVIPLVAGDNDITIILDTSTNSGPYSLDIDYNSPFVDFDYNSYKFDPVNIHGEGLFFGPYLKVLDTPENIGEPDIRVLTVPLGWKYSVGGVPIWDVYTEVGSAAGPTCPYPVFLIPGTWNWIGP